MKDQVHNLRQRGIKAICIYSGMCREEIIVALENCIFGDYKFLYISPERLSTEIFKTKLRSMKISMITVDESHCISQWGYDFRPAYLNISEIRDLLPSVPILALTATATPEVVEDIQKKLRFNNGKVFRMSFERKNVAYVVRKTENKEEELLHILTKLEGSAIVYTRNRKKTKEITSLLNSNSIPSTFYHAGLNNDTKDLRQKDWVNDKIRVMVATNAFGMGIDKPNVRVVIHIDLPDSPEAYFQEAGRAGRDGEKAFAVLLYSKSDKQKLSKRISDTFPEKEYIRKVYEDINYFYQMAMGDGKGCSFPFDIEKFCRNFKHFPLQVDSSLKILNRAGYLEYTDEQDNGSRIIFKIRRDELYKLFNNNAETDKLINVILRSYTGVFTDFTFINEETISIRSGLSRQQIYDILILLTKRNIIHYIPAKKTPYIIYTKERNDSSKIILSEEVYEKRKESYSKRINAIIDYATSEENCRSRMLLRYFGEKNQHNCGQCDVCIKKKKDGITNKELKDIEKQIKTLLKDGAKSIKTVTRLIDYDEEKINETISFMLDEEVIKINDGYINIC